MSQKTINEFKRTKILATIGPASNDKKTIKEIIKSGANGIRLNFSHGDYDEREQQIKWIREIEKETGRPIAVVQDIQGPKIRIGKIEPHEVVEGEVIKLALKPAGREGVLPVQYDLSKKVKKGQRVLIFDGKVQTIVKSIDKDIVSLEAQNKGWLMSKKGINIPDTDLAGDILTSKDKKDLKFGKKIGVDYVALSFVQGARDVEKTRVILKKLKSKAKLISKIETRAAVDNLEEIIAASDGVMVARGDLAIETAPEEVPIIQRKIIGLAQKQGKISIVATQMLASMVDVPTPTRAEVSDVATSVIVGADAVMLSEETAAGEFPVESVKYMRKILRYTEINAPVKPLFLLENDNSIDSSISSAVMTLAHQVKATAIVTETASGRTARSVASHRPTMPIVMVTDDIEVARQLALVYGGKSRVRPSKRTTKEKLTKWLKKQKILAKDQIVVITSGKYPGRVGGTDTIKVRKL